MWHKLTCKFNKLMCQANKHLTFQRLSCLVSGTTGIGVALVIRTTVGPDAFILVCANIPEAAHIPYTEAHVAPMSALNLMRFCIPFDAAAEMEVMISFARRDDINLLRTSITSFCC